MKTIQIQPVLITRDNVRHLFSPHTQHYRKDQMFCPPSFLSNTIANIAVPKVAPASSTSSANKVFGVRIDEKMVKKLKIMAVDEDTSACKLLEEALNMLFASRKQSK